jgi:hypothetical protein
MTMPNGETEQQRIDRIVREVLAGQRSLADVRRSVDRIAGRPLGDYSGVDDSAWLSDPARLAQRVRDIFVNRGVTIATAPTVPYRGIATDESEDARLTRIAQEVLAGRRSLDDVRRSVDLQAGRQSGQYGNVDDSPYQTLDQIKERIRQVFTNRSVPIATATPQAPATPSAPNTPPSVPQPDVPRIDPAKEAADRARRDAYARLNRVLNDYGLGSLGKTVQRWLIEGLSEDEITQRIRETNEFKQRFPAIEERRKKGLPALSPGEYVAYERNVAQLMRAAGLPRGFYDSTEDFTRFLTNDVSLAELGDRVTLAANAAFKMPAEDRAALERWGLGPGDMTAFWLDPDKAQPLLERRFAAAQLAGTASRSGFGALNERTATGLATLGVTQEEAERGFGTLVDSRELFGSLDRGEDRIGQDVQLGAAFGGSANAQRRIEQRRRRRQAQFESGGGFASGQTGLVGLGDTE